MRQFQYLKIPFASTEELFHSRAYGGSTCIQPLSVISLKDKEKEGVKGGGGGCVCVCEEKEILSNRHSDIEESFNYRQHDVK